MNQSYEGKIPAVVKFVTVCTSDVVKDQNLGLEICVLGFIVLTSNMAETRVCQEVKNCNIVFEGTLCHTLKKSLEVKMSTSYFLTLSAMFEMSIKNFWSWNYDPWQHMDKPRIPKILPYKATSIFFCLQQWLKNQVIAKGSFWIGLTDSAKEDEWRWLDGTLPEYMYV